MNEMLDVVYGGRNREPAGVVLVPDHSSTPV